MKSMIRMLKLQVTAVFPDVFTRVYIGFYSQFSGSDEMSVHNPFINCAYSVVIGNVIVGAIFLSLFHSKWLFI